MHLKYLLFIAFLISQTYIHAQGNPTSYFQYTYDNAGNRISREFIVLTPRPLDSLPDSIIRQYGLIARPRPRIPLQEQNTTSGQEISGKTGVAGLSVIRIYPNPAKTELQISGSLADGEVIKLLSLHAMDGKTLRTEEHFSIPGTLSLAGLPSGSYILRFRTSEKSREWVVVKLD
jgi:YD repeat-containing protein